MCHNLTLNFSLLMCLDDTFMKHFRLTSVCYYTLHLAPYFSAVWYWEHKELLFVAESDAFLFS